MFELSRIFTRDALAVRIALALLFGSASFGIGPSAAPAQPGPLVPPAVCVPEGATTTAAQGALAKGDREKRFLGDAFVRTELFFGSERPDLPEVSPEEFEEFLDAVVTPCFPDGLTLLTGKGQFRESDDVIVQETSFVLVLLYPLETRKESNVKIEAIRTLYKDHFLQQSVLRVDDPRAARVGF